jgi:hypothetical protein
MDHLPRKAAVAILRHYRFVGERPDWVPKVIGRLLSGNGNRVDGVPYNAELVERIWTGLYQCCRDPKLRARIMARKAGPELASLTMEDAVTIAGRVRANVNYTQARNTPFQSLAADGAKLACLELVRHGYRLVAFIHDEFLIELPEHADHTAEAERVRKTVCGAMSRVVFGMVPVRAEYALSSCWSKEARELRDKARLLLPWSPRSEMK